MALDTSSAAAILKEYYSNQRVEQLTYQDMPLYAMLKKVKDFEGSSYPLPMRVTDPQGASATFSNAQAQKQPSNYKKFSLTRVKSYSLASIETEAMLASKSNPGAFLQLATAEIDGAIHTMKRRLGWAIYGDGSGALGSIGSVSSTNPEVITLTTADDIVKFEVGQTIQARLGATTRIFATATPSAVITKVDRDAGTITLGAVDNSGNTDTIVAGDTLNVVGDYNAMLSGLEAWVPAATPSATPYFGVDRTIDATRLGGVRVASTGKPIDEALIDAARRLGREGLGKPDCVFTGFSKYAALEKTLGAKIRYKDTEIAGISFRGIEVSGPNGTLTVYPDRDCPDNRMYILDMASWGLYSLGEPVRLLDQDGNKMLRESTADALEVRVGGYFQVGNTMPGSNAVLVF